MEEVIWEAFLLFILSGLFLFCLYSSRAVSHKSHQSGGRSFLSTPAYGPLSKMSHKSCLEWQLLSKWWHHKISACTTSQTYSGRRSCPWWHISFPSSTGATFQELSMVTTLSFQPQPTALVNQHCRSCPQWQNLLSSLLRIPIEALPLCPIPCSLLPGAQGSHPCIFPSSSWILTFNKALL